MGHPVDQGAYEDPQRHHLGKGDGKCLLDEAGHRDHSDGHDEQHGGSLVRQRLLHQTMEQQCDEQHRRQRIVGQQGHQQHAADHHGQQQGATQQPFAKAERLAGATQHHPGHDDPEMRHGQRQPVADQGCQCDAGANAQYCPVGVMHGSLSRGRSRGSSAGYGASPAGSSPSCRRHSHRYRPARRPDRRPAAPRPGKSAALKAILTGKR